VSLPPGAYDRLVTRAIGEALDASSLVADTEQVDAADAADKYSLLIREVTRRAIQSLPSDKRVEAGAELANAVLKAITQHLAKIDTSGDHIVTTPSPLTLVEMASPSPTGEVMAIGRPKTPLGLTSLLTNAPREPSLLHELESEIASADDVEILVAFIRFSGIRQMIPHLRRLVERGGRIRVLTTTFTGTTEARALDELTSLGAQVKISYDRTATRLHAKAWLFRRKSGFSTTYIGSSNATAHAQVPGLEWNVRASTVANPELIAKFEATFDSYWEDENFVPYNPDQFNHEMSAVARSQDKDVFEPSFIELHPYPFQDVLLERVMAERAIGHHRNLIVSATGTGKTVMAAIDYRRLRHNLDRQRLLFVAHRKEILEQSQSTFRTALQDHAFSERWVDGARPEKWDHVFASVQSIAAGDLTTLAPDHFDVVIVDEFHHAEAPTYRAILEYVQPKELIGLTATPERADGQDVVRYFDGRIAAELRLWDALDAGRLVPFHYFGVSDGIDLSEVKWAAGKYDATELTNLYTADDRWAGQVLRQVHNHIGDPKSMRALGFCVGVEHAKFMARKFTEAGLTAEAVVGTTDRDDRRNAIHKLRSGEIQAIFAVDVFNEGVDIPEVDTVLFLRPTESSTVFLQQLGRGLRQTNEASFSNKDLLTVVDFVGNHRKEFRFDQRFRKLLGGSRMEIQAQIEEDFPFLPAGCSIRLDAVAKETVLRNIKESLPTGWRERQAEAKLLGDVHLSDYLEHTGLELADVYRGGHSYTDLRRTVGFLDGDASPEETRLGRALGRMLHIGDGEHLQYLLSVLGADEPPIAGDLSDVERRRLTMLHYSLWGTNRKLATSLADGLAALWEAAPIRSELLELLSILAIEAGPSNADHPLGHDVPLALHRSYSRDEILGALDDGTPELPPVVREGTRWIEDMNTSVSFVTLNKSEKDYSPSTMYNDYAVSRDLFHWETQSTTSVQSKTGQRYLSQRENGINVAMCVRSSKKNSNGQTAPYTFIGLADYVTHTGDRPIAITWKLRQPMRAADFVNYRAAIA